MRKFVAVIVLALSVMLTAGCNPYQTVILKINGYEVQTGWPEVHDNNLYQYIDRVIEPDAPPAGDTYAGCDDPTNAEMDYCKEMKP